MNTRDVIEIANWVRAELVDTEENGDMVSRIDALRLVQNVLRALDLTNVRKD